jgi:hypothetical protein
MLQGIREDMAAIKATLASKADKADVAAIQAMLPTLATKAEVAAVKGDTMAIQAVLPTLATAADVSRLGYDLTWRLIGLLAVILAVYLGAVWWIVVHLK